jgi:hypothetical protein
MCLLRLLRTLAKFFSTDFLLFASERSAVFKMGSKGRWLLARRLYTMSVIPMEEVNGVLSGGMYVI